MSEHQSTLSDDTQGCEYCDGVFPLDQVSSMGDSYICRGCYAKWRQHFDTCQHSWIRETNEWNEPAAFCSRCSGQVALADFPQLGIDPATVPEERADAE